MVACGVAGSTRIYNPIDSSLFTVRELCEQKQLPFVATLMGPMEVTSITKKNQAILTEIVTSRGRRLHVTSNTRVLCTDGWEYISNVETGSAIGIGSNYLYANVVWDTIIGLVRVMDEPWYELRVPVAGHYSANWIWICSQ